MHLSKQYNYAQLSSTKKYCKIYTNVVSGKCPFCKGASCISEQVLFWTSALSPIKYTQRSHDSILWSHLNYMFTHLSKTHSKKKSWSYKIYVHKGTVILLKPAMLQYKSSISAFHAIKFTNKFKSSSSKINCTRTVSFPFRKKNNQLLFNQLKVPTGTWKKYIKCFVFPSKFARLSRLFVIRRK